MGLPRLKFLPTRGRQATLEEFIHLCLMVESPKTTNRKDNVIMKKPKIPTIEVYLAYNGAHCHYLWNHVSESWRCPGCGRSKFQIMRWTKRFVKNGVRCKPYRDWIAILHGHHDHGNNSRFDKVLLCGQCNSADAAVKKKLNLNDCFSFSPLEIREFVKATPHGMHKIDYVKARQVYERVNSI